MFFKVFGGGGGGIFIEPFGGFLDGFEELGFVLVNLL